MNRHKNKRPSHPNLSTAILVLGASLVIAVLTANNEAIANQPPPPPPSDYTLTVTRDGGDSTCEVQIALPGASPWTTTSVQDTFVSGTEYAPTHRVNCPSEYKFVRWESAEDSNLHGWRENRSPDFELLEDTTATAVFEDAGIVKPTEHGIAVSGSAGGSYGAVVRLIYEDAADWQVRETVTWAASEPTGYTDCAPHGTITQQPNFVSLNPCDLDGTENPSGSHGFITDSIMNNNGPPWFLLDAFVAQSKSFPCSSTTEQISHVRPYPCYPAFDYPHTQRVYLWSTDADNGSARGWSSGVGGITTPWTRP